ncbi:3-methyladenine DNA glycosylase [Thermobifida cellulosilytica]|uniref:3-methyladenine DNA glycosylase n=1 Tax=Thermobifida cellulosilytica TB100 TaxID=665004 RepID=A0A147KDX2_THECS|nr:3-methyladenine DNA glycosylase [Thermobifida cellulosilytica]KUP95485.1 3-methyladenine DNA glycosylase [Thermobifida cellulosilytica TB100]
MDSVAPSPIPATRTVLTEQEWRERAARHAERAEEFVRSAQRPAARPVESFLFTYYSYRPAQLRRWHPGPGVVLLGESARAEFRRWYRTVTVPDASGTPHTGVELDVAAFVADRGRALRFVADLLSAVRARSANFGCFGLHEWAMVYRQSPEERRHALPLRLGAEATDRVVESHRIRCSHFDAFRFFTPEARPLNQLQPTRDTQIALDQPGCLHATMDCYKWAYKLSPAVPGELLLDCFELARDVRELDMRASPYDLSAHGYAPVCVETPEGKAEYAATQRVFSERGQVLRDRLLEVIAALGVAVERPAAG